MKKLDQFVLKKIQEKSRQFLFLTSQLELILPTELLHRFSVCGISDTSIKICVNTSSDHSLIRFYLKNIKKKCHEIYNNKKLKIIFCITPDKTGVKEKQKPNRIISEGSKSVIKSYAKNEPDREMQKILLRLIKSE